MPENAFKRESSVLQVVICKAKPGTSDARVLEVAEGIMPRLRAASGFVHRELRKTDDGRWVDCLWWTSLEEGERIGMSVHESPEGQAMFGALEESDFTMFNFLPVSKG